MGSSLARSAGVMTSAIASRTSWVWAVGDLPER
jgi:hypothetical protein